MSRKTKASMPRTTASPSDSSTTRRDEGAPIERVWPQRPWRVGRVQRRSEARPPADQRPADLRSRQGSRRPSGGLARLPSLRRDPGTGLVFEWS
jgi:hypothetical protein